MSVIEIERYESPYSKNNPHSVVAAGGGCCCSCCCCCCTSSFILPEILVLSSVGSKSQLTKEEIMKKYLLIHGISFGVIYFLGLGLTLGGRPYISGSILNVLFVIGIIGVIGALILNPVIMSSISRKAKDAAVNKNPNALYAFLIGLASIVLYSVTILPILFSNL